MLAYCIVYEKLEPIITCNRRVSKSIFAYFCSASELRLEKREWVSSVRKRYNGTRKSSPPPAGTTAGSSSSTTPTAAVDGIELDSGRPEPLTGGQAGPDTDPPQSRYRTWLYFNTLGHRLEDK